MIIDLELALNKFTVKDLFFRFNWIGAMNEIKDFGRGVLIENNLQVFQRYTKTY